MLARLLLALVLPACSAMMRPVQDGAQETDPDAGYRTAFQAEKGLILGLRGQWARLGSEFDGDTTLVGPDTITLPDAGDGRGFELSIGGIDEGQAVLLSYGRMEYEGSLAGTDADIDYRAFALDLVQYLRANEPVEPYLLLGFLLPFADLENASTNGIAIGDAKLRSGWGLRFGGGLAWWLGHHLALDVRSAYELQWYGEAEGVAGDAEDIDDDVRGSSFGFSVGLTWVPGGSS